MKLLFLDFETFSPVPIQRGLDVYMRPAEIMLAQWALNGGPVHVHDFTEDPIQPQELMDLINDPEVLIVAHNAAFERLALKHCWGIELPPERFFCTMACALAHSLPGGLGLLADVLKCEAKLEGKDHINLFCKPAPRTLRRATRETHPAEWAEFMEYARGDVVTCREVYHALPKRNYTAEHRRLWFIDQKINERGFAVDRDLAQAAVELLAEDKKRLDQRAQELTGGELRSASQRDKLLLFLCREHGVLLESMQADQLADALDDDRLPEPVKELIRVRIATAMASTAKFSKLLLSAGPDDRLRGTLQYCGASRTGRWSGKIFQPQNLRRPTMPQGDIDAITQLIKERDGDSVTLYAGLQEACSNIMRGLIVAPPGKKLVVSDWSGIESRVLAWLAGEQWVLDVSVAADENRGQDLYVHTVCRAYGIDVNTFDKDSKEGSYLRQQGKGMVLSLGYEGGVAAFISIAAAYGLDLDELGHRAPDILPSEHMLRARDTFAWAAKKGKTYGLPEHVYVACEAIKLAYREANPNIAAQWRQYKDAFALVTMYPGEKVETGRCLFYRRGNWTMVDLPSGRTLMYPSPRVHQGGQLSYMGQANKRWVRIKTYGGKIAENITQAVSNDILRAALLNLVDDGFTPVLHVHDEIVCEQDANDDYHNIDRLNQIMRRELPWSKGLPLHTAGWEGNRYKK
ncbi:MAG: DNA polymerase [Gammaproteobacteria bacterium]